VPGAFIASSLVGLMGLIGIPRSIDSNLYPELFRIYTDGKLKQLGVADRAIVQYNYKIY
jgi:hypothetical protein